jgi:hypothetical protein
MASVTLVDAWFHLASDPSQYVVMELTGESDMTARPVSVRRYAGGRVRSITRPGVKKQLNLNFDLASRADMHVLEDWVGQTVLYRDPRGRRLWGVFAAVDEAEIPGAEDDTVNVNLTLLEVTFDESA